MIHESALRRFEVPRTIVQGGGCRSQLPALVRELGGTRVLVVTDPGVVQRGVAGGSPIDTTKVIAIRLANPQPLPELMGLHKIAHPGLPTVMHFSLTAAPERYAIIARTVGCDSLIPWLEALNAEVEKMATDALASGSPANNPRVPTALEIVALYHAAW